MSELAVPVPHCLACGGTVRLVRAEGRTWTYRGRSVVIPADVELPTCEACGEHWLGPAAADHLDELLETLTSPGLRS